MFLSATLLFLVQPMIAKMILPLLGGTPAVWNTCMVFFQAALLAGYSYAHVSTTWLRTRWQVTVHIAVLFLPIVLPLVLPFLFRSLPVSIAKDVAPPVESEEYPHLLALWVPWLLFQTIFLPFLVLSTSAPLLQKWFAQTGHASAKDPYFLYAASNLGSMLALLGYPTLIEPFLPLKPEVLFSQSWLWTFGYGLLVALTVCCASVVWHSSGAAEEAKSPISAAIAGETIESAPRPRLSTRLRWVALAFVPSSLMLGATTYITLDIASIPLLWIIPLALYLLSFIIVFAKWPERLHKAATLIMPLLILIVVFVMQSEILKRPFSLIIALHLLTLFVTALVCHGELALTRPSTRYLTEFYLLMSFGGVLGGLFNALVAPVVFDFVAEYSIAMVVACLLLPGLTSGSRGLLSRWVPERFAAPAAIGVDMFMALLLYVFTFFLSRFLTIPLSHILPDSWFALFRAHIDAGFDRVRDWLDEWLRVSLSPDILKQTVICGVPILICYAFIARPVRFGLGVAALLLATGLAARDTSVVHQERSFFGVLKVKVGREPPNDYVTVSLVHGTTLHGKQIRDEEHPDLRKQPLTYYHLTGPVGQVFTAMKEKLPQRRVAAIGLGSGSLACYSNLCQRMTFFDIDMAVFKIAAGSTDRPPFFTYLSDHNNQWQIVIGDARLKMDKADPKQFQLIFVDAFSSDAIPIHLITREAIEMYLRKLTDDGIIAMHISNRHLDLEPVLGNIAEELQLATLHEYDQEETSPGKTSSDWVLLARKREDFGALLDDSRWQPARTDPKVGVWTDDYSNLLSVFNDYRSFLDWLRRLKDGSR
jgi:hypothetical protein